MLLSGFEMALRFRQIAIAWALVVAGCTCDGARGDFGDPCSTNEDCRDGLFCHETYDGRERYCSRECRQGHDDCPDGWHCDPEPYDPRDGTCERG